MNVRMLMETNRMFSLLVLLETLVSGRFVSENNKSSSIEVCIQIRFNGDW